jgi:hypothetical protein
VIPDIIILYYQEDKMKFVNVLILTGVAALLNGCTVLGFATDLALIGASEKSACNHSTQNSCRSDGGEELFFTAEGLKQDIKIVKKVIDQIEDANPDQVEVEPELQTLKPERPKVVACKKVIDGQQQCYSAEYYKDMYIATK